MASKPTEFMKAHNVASDEVWEVRRGGAWAIKHSALERIASQRGITFDVEIIVADAIAKAAVMRIIGKMGDRTEWSLGEAAPYNNLNNYPFAMAEKRGKDRVILKLLQSHGAVYSEAEADEFAPHQGDDGMKTKFIEMAREYIRVIDDATALGIWWNSPEQSKARRDFELSAAELKDLKEFCISRLDQLKKKAA